MYPNTEHQSEQLHCPQPKVLFCMWDNLVDTKIASNTLLVTMPYLLMWRPSLMYRCLICDDTFSFVPHIDNICTKASLTAKLILKCFQTRCTSVLFTAYYTFVRPILEYASEIWNTNLRYL